MLRRIIEIKSRITKPVLIEVVTAALSYQRKHSQKEIVVHKADWNVDTEGDIKKVDWSVHPFILLMQQPTHLCLKRDSQKTRMEKQLCLFMFKHSAVFEDMN